MNMRERMAMALHDLGPHDYGGCTWTDEDLYRAIDTVLAEMETPSEGAVVAAMARLDIPFFSDIEAHYIEMIRVIKEGN